MGPFPEFIIGRDFDKVSRLERASNTREYNVEIIGVCYRHRGLLHTSSPSPSSICQASEPRTTPIGARNLETVLRFRRYEEIY